MPRGKPRETAYILENHDWQLVVETRNNRGFFIGFTFVLIVHFLAALSNVYLQVTTVGIQSNYLTEPILVIILCIVTGLFVGILPYQEYFYFDKNAKTVTWETRYFLQLSRSFRILWNWHLTSTVSLHSVDTIKVVKTSLGRYGIVFSPEKPQSFARHLISKSVYTVPNKSTPKSAIASLKEKLNYYLWAEVKIAKTKDSNAVSLKAVYPQRVYEIIAILQPLLGTSLAIFQKDYQNFWRLDTFNMEKQSIDRCVQLCQENRLAGGLYKVNQAGSILDYTKF